MDVFARNSSGNILASGSASGSIVRINVDVPAWNQLGQRNGYQFIKAVDIIKDQFSYYNYSGGSTGSISSQSTKWHGGVLAPNGCIYGVPHVASSSIKIDTNIKNGAITFVGSGSFTPGGSGLWAGGSLGGDGKIYCSPLNATNVLVINPNTDTMSIIPAILGFIGAVTANDGNVYFVPYTATAIGKVDLSRQIFMSFGNITGNNKYHGGVLAPNNGCIYFVPWDAATIIKLNPVTDQITTFASFPAGGGKWSGGVLGPNGLIYCIPANSTGSLIINPFNDTYAISGSLAAASKYQGGALGLDGNIYAFSAGTTNYLKINTTTNTLTETSIAVSSRIGSVLGANGNIYGIPSSATSVGILSMNVSASVDINIPLSRYINKSI